MTWKSIAPSQRCRGPALPRKRASPHRSRGSSTSGGREGPTPGRRLSALGDDPVLGWGPAMAARSPMAPPRISAPTPSAPGSQAGLERLGVAEGDTLAIMLRNDIAGLEAMLMAR